MPDNDFGYTAWGRDWVRLAEPIRQTQPDLALPRARRLTRAGGVQLTVDGTDVRAEVRRGRTTATTRITLRPMSPETTRAIYEYSSRERLTVSDDLHRKVTAAGHRPAPTPVTMSCTCADDSERCVHLLATLYELARRIDEDPWIALRVQGVVGSAHTFDVVSPQPDRSIAPQRWVALDVVDRSQYFEVLTTPDQEFRVDGDTAARVCEGPSRGSA